MYKVYVVCWGHAGVDDRGNGDAFCNVHKVYWNLCDAKVGLEELKNEFVDEIVNKPDFDEDDQAIARNHLQIYGSVDSCYFELDYDNCDIVEETYLTIVEKEVL